MLKWLYCKILGTSCAWKTIHTERYQRDAYGIHVGVTPRRVLCETHAQQCAKCGAVRSKDIQLTA
jgi:hypothetical protein